MNPKELVELLKPATFEPFVIVMNSGGRYEVTDRRTAQVMDKGTVYVFEPSDRDDDQYRTVTRLSYTNIAAIEPVRGRAA